MENDISPLDARILRDAFRGTQDIDLTGDAIEGDYVDLRVRAVEATRGVEIFIAIHKDGAQVATCVVSNATLKKLKRDMERIRIACMAQHGDFAKARTKARSAPSD